MARLPRAWLAPVDVAAAVAPPSPSALQMQAVFGCQKELEISRLVGCEACNNTGVKAGTSPQTCYTCRGSGQVIQMVRTPLGVFQNVSICGECGGTGQKTTPCDVCGGDGRVRKGKVISMKARASASSHRGAKRRMADSPLFRTPMQIPAGVDQGSRLRVKGEGNAGRRGGPAGDLFVFCNVKEDPDLQREGTNIRSEINVPFYDAILGTSVQIRTVDGMVDLKIPPGTQPNTVLLMSRRGVPKLSQPNQRGDHLVRVKVQIPQKLREEERKLVEKLRELSGATSTSAPSGGSGAKKGWPFG